MKARVNGWHIEADVVRSLGSNPHRVDVTAWGRNDAGSAFTFSVQLTPADAESLGVLLDAAGAGLRDCADADTCEHCQGPCDPGETYCPSCEETKR